MAKDDGWCVARCLEVKVASQGETVDEALANLREALESYFEDDEGAGSSTGGTDLFVSGTGSRSPFG